ncbi:MAG: glycosyltransferase family A protein [Acidimicrobiales bacterium]
MTPLAIAVVAVGWVAGTILLWRVRTPDGLAAGDGGLVATMSVIVPARDEELTLPRLLGSLADQHAAPLEVIFVDDGSTDQTAAVAERSGARVVHASGPPPGWTGKTWACQLGVEAARGQRLLFLDADTWLAPNGVARLAATHGQLTPGGLLSVQPFHVTERPYEQLSALCNVVAVMGSGIAAPRASEARVAFGPCLLCTPESLAAAGGYEAVRHDSIEDMALARAFRAAGRSVACLGGGATVMFRMYPAGFRSLVAGWTKNLAGGARQAPAVAVLGAVAWVCALVIVAIAGLTVATWWAAVAWIAVAAQLAWMLGRLGSFRWWTSVLFPVPLVAFIALFAWSGISRGMRRRVTWRGRVIDVGRG